MFRMYFDNGFWNTVRISDMYELKPKYKKQILEQEAENLKLSIKSLTSSLADLQKQLEEKEKELKELK